MDRILQNYEQIEREQKRQEALRRLPQLDPERYMRQQLGSTELVVFNPRHAQFSKHVAGYVD